MNLTNELRNNKILGIKAKKFLKLRKKMLLKGVPLRNLSFIVDNKKVAITEDFVESANYLGKIYGMNVYVGVIR